MKAGHYEGTESAAGRRGWAEVVLERGDYSSGVTAVSFEGEAGRAASPPATTGAPVHGPACAHGRVAAPTAKRVAATRGSAAIVLAVLTGLSVLVLVRNPLENTVFPPCPLHVTTGLWCPGCGATRASYLLLHGDVAGALHFNGLWVVLAPFVVYQVASFVAESFGLRWLRRIPMSQAVTVALLASMAGFFLVRNLPFELFEVLNPLSAS